MNVLIVNTLYHPNIVGGAEKSVQSLAEGLVAHGHGVAVATLNPEKRREVGEVNRVRVHYLPLKNLYPFPHGGKRPPGIARAIWHALDSFNPFMSTSLGRVLDGEQPDVVHTHNLCGFSASVWRAVKNRRLPLVHTIRDHYLVCSRSTMFDHGMVCPKPCTTCRIYSGPRRRLSRLVDVVTGISHNVLDGSCAHGCFSESRKMVVHNAFESQPDNGKHRNGRNGAVRFGYIGRLHPSKGIDLLIQSFLKLPAGRAKLLIAGRGDSQYEDALRRLINSHPAIQMLGFTSPGELLHQVDVLVVPSLWHEPAGRVVLESMAHRVPVIGSCRGGIAEQMGEGTGWVFDPDQPGDLTQTLQLAIDSPAELMAMSEQASQRITQFSTERMVNGYLRAYSCAIERNSQSSQGRRSAAS